MFVDNNSVTPSASDGSIRCMESAISFLDRFVISQYNRSYAAYIEVIDFELAEFPNQEINTLSKIPSVQSPNERVIETLILEKECPSSHNRHIPVFVCEQWILKSEPISSPVFNEQSMETLQKEITSYFASSPLSLWLQEQRRSKQYKVANRIFANSETRRNPGTSFVLSIDQSSPILPPGELLHNFIPGCVKKPLPTPTSDSSGLCGKESDFHSPWLCHTFSALRVSSNNVLRLSVLSAKRIPMHFLECPVCCDPSMKKAELTDNGSTVKSVRNVSHISELNHCKVTCDDGGQNSLTGTPCSSADVKETLNSPVVVVTDLHNSFFHDFSDSICDFPFLPVSEFDCSTDSATSTLTKKSRVTNSDDAILPHFESPPRKQQRVSRDSNTSDACDVAQTSLVLENDGAKSNRIGSMDKVIAEFTQLNVERADFTDTNSYTGKEHFFLHSDDHQKKCTTSHIPAKKHECHPYSSNVDSACPSRPGMSGHLPRERRRNATSACIPNWSLSLHKEGQLFFNRRTGLPLQSSPVPLKRSTSGRFDFDASLCSLKGSKSSTCMTSGLEDPHPEPHPLIRCDSTKGNSPLPKKDTSNVSSGVQLRRRPASLRLNVPTAVQNGRHEGPVRRRKCTAEMNQSEISCSAPPSGDRGSLYSDAHRRLANTLACTPLSHSSSQHLLVNFEESMLNGRIHPVGEVEGFTLELGASGSFFPAHERLPMKAYFFDLSDDNKPSPYLGYADLCQLRGGKGYLIPMKGSVQLTLFNPNKVVVKMFVIGYDFEDMPRNSQTFLRQRTVYMPVRGEGNQQLSGWTENSSHEHRVDTKEDQSRNDRTFSSHLFGMSEKQSHLLPSSSSVSSCSCSSLSSLSSECSLASLSSNQTVNSLRPEQNAFLRYLVHLRFHTTRSGRLYLHTDIRLIFARDKFEFDPRVANYELRSFIDAPTNPRYSPKKWTKRPRTSLPFVPRITSP